MQRSVSQPIVYVLRDLAAVRAGLVGVFPKENGPVACGNRAVFKRALAATYFPTQEYAVSSAKVGLTSEFGMGSGVPPPL